MAEGLWRVHPINRKTLMAQGLRDTKIPASMRVFRRGGRAKNPLQQKGFWARERVRIEARPAPWRRPPRPGRLPGSRWRWDALSHPDRRPPLDLVLGPRP